MVAVKEYLLAKDVEKIVKGKEFDGTEFADSVFLSDDEDSGSLKIRTKKMQTPISSPPRSPRKDLSLYKAIAQELMVSVSLTPASSSQDHSKLNSNKCKILPRSIAQMSRRRGQLRKQTNRTFVINNYFQDKMKEMNETIHNTVPELTDVLKAKFKRFLASAGSCRDDAFRKRDHDEHQGDYERQQQQQEWDAWVEDPVIDEDEVIVDDETPEIIEEYTKEYAYYLEQSRNYLENQKVWESMQEDLRRSKPYALVFYGPSDNIKYEPTRFMDLEELPYFCDSTLENVLKEVNMKIFETEFLKKAPLLGSLDLIIMKAYEREIKKRLSHSEHMRRYESFVNGIPVLQTMRHQ
ncbi:ribonuclease H-like domain-containing protein [Tanacetum coccineum]